MTGAELIASTTFGGVDRETGIGGSDIAAICGLNPFRSVLDVYFDKVGGVEREPAGEAAQWGKRLERIIAERYGEIRGQQIGWIDESARGPHPWFVWRPDAVVLAEDRGLDAKCAGARMAYRWGEQGSDEIPDEYALQAQWYLIASRMSAWDFAVLIGGNDFRIYTVTPDPVIQQTLLEKAEAFWRDHVEPKVMPPLDASDAAARYLRQRFPRNLGTVRHATDEEMALMMQYRSAHRLAAEAVERKNELGNKLRAAIGESDGIERYGVGKLTWRRCKDTLGTDWEAVARRLGEKYLTNHDFAKLLGQHEVTRREGARRLLAKFVGEEIEEQGEE